MHQIETPHIPLSKGSSVVFRGCWGRVYLDVFGLGR